MSKLSEKVAIVTGASSGMGRAIALLFAEQGAAVVAADIDKDGLDSLARELEPIGATILAVPSDISKDADIERLFDAALSAHGSVDILVNNAGVMDDFNGAGEQPLAIWDRTMDININGPFRTSRRAVQIMLANGKGGAIVNNSSICGLVGARAGAAYVASKHAMVGLTRNTAFMYATRGIRCNMIAPGSVATNIRETSGFSLDHLPERVSSVIMPARDLTNPRTAEPREIANVALFLASDDASFVNGALVTADGGWTCY